MRGEGVRESEKKFKPQFIMWTYCFYSSMLGTSEGEVVQQLKMLQGRNLIKEHEPGKWVRKVLDEKTGQKN